MVSGQSTYIFFLYIRPYANINLIVTLTLNPQMLPSEKKIVFSEKKRKRNDDAISRNDTLLITDASLKC